ncbi:uncharacterized protein ACDP82_002685 [Pangshura tecta]
MTFLYPLGFRPLLISPCFVDASFLAKENWTRGLENGPSLSSPLLQCCLASQTHMSVPSSMLSFTHARNMRMGSCLLFYLGNAKSLWMLLEISWILLTMFAPAPGQRQPTNAPFLGLPGLSKYPIILVFNIVWSSLKCGSHDVNICKKLYFIASFNRHHSRFGQDFL